MKVNKLQIVYFSPTGNTRKVAQVFGEALAENLGIKFQEFDATLPGAREIFWEFGAGELFLFATPVYAGRVPNKIMPYVREHFRGNGALVLSVVTFGNRSFDNALAELRDIFTENGFSSLAACAVPAEHVFSPKLAAGRPSVSDLKALRQFAGQVAHKLSGLEELPQSLTVDGEFPAPYYTPLGSDGNPAVFLKAKPKTDVRQCIRCGKCAAGCPMGAISRENPCEVTGICIKCHACIKGCPKGAKYLDDPAFLSHVEMLENTYTRPAKASWYL